MDIQDVNNLEKVTGQIEGLHRELSLLAKKSSTDGLNPFKLNMLNASLAAANGILGDHYKPIAGFEQFDPDGIPSNSDATVVLAMYLEELERYRTDNIKMLHSSWFYNLGEEGPKIRCAPPKKLVKK